MMLRKNELVVKNEKRNRVKEKEVGEKYEREIEEVHMS
jgi:hypothetical protein